MLKPPYATISAINLDKGDIVWQVAHGDTPDAIRNNPALKGINVPRTGQAGFNIGTLVTKSLVIAGDGQVTTTPDHPRGAPLRAYDQATGKEVGNVLMPARAVGLADDLYGQWQAVHHRRGVGRRLFRRVYLLHVAG